ncbi:MAG: hypothetical protein LIO90_08230 [Bacteroidales bacterium]|nr:hypothetical protein [Bacteroidales bacterium]
MSGWPFRVPPRSSVDNLFSVGGFCGYAATGGGGHRPESGGGRRTTIAAAARTTPPAWPPCPSALSVDDFPPHAGEHASRRALL